MDSRDNSRGVWRAIIVWGAGDLYFIVSVIIAVLFGILSPDLQKQLHLDSAQLGLLGLVVFLSYGLAQLVAGSLMDSWNPRLILAGSAVIASGGLFLLSAAEGFKMAIAAQFLIGAGLSTSYIGAIYLAATWFPSERFPLVSGITQMSANLMVAAVVLGMALSGALVSFRIVMSSLGFVTLCTAVLMLLIIRSAPVPKPDPAGEHSKRKFVSDLRTLVRIPQFWLGTIYFSAGFGVLLAFSNLWHVPDQLAYGHTLRTAAMMNAMLPLGGALGAILSGWLADYLGRRSEVAKFYSAGMLVMYAVLVYGPHMAIPLAFLHLVLLGFFFGGAVLGFPLVGQNIPTIMRGTGFGLMATMAYLVSALLQYLVGALLGEVSTPGPTAVHEFKVALVPLVVTLAIGFICSWWLRDPKPSPTSQGVKP